MKTTISIFILSLLVSLWGCRRSDDFMVTDEGTPTVLKLEVGEEINEEEVLGTKARDENAMDDLNVIIFNSEGALLSHDYFSGTGNRVTVNTTSGSRQIAIVANYGSKMSGITQVSDLNNSVFTSNTPVEMERYPMSKLITTTIPIPSSVGGSVTIDPILLKRLTSKITVVFDKSGLNSNVTIKPIRVVLRQVPSIATLFINNSPTVVSSIIERGDSIASTTEIAPLNHESAIPLYMLENVQGNNGSNTDQRIKTPASGKEKLVSFLEVYANYVSLEKSGIIKYRYYLGKDITKNFDMSRNSWYKITISFKGKGGASENTWRVNTTEIDDLFRPKKMMIPWGSGRANFFILDELSWTSNIPLIAGNQVERLSIDSIQAILPKLDNLGGSSIDVGYFKNNAQTKQFDVIHRNKNSLDFLVDVSALHFPRNTTFGSKNYPITQHINVVYKGSNITSWNVWSSADWVYVGSGDNVQAFSSSGVAAPSGYSNMSNRSGGPLNFTTSVQQLSIRCTANTSNQNRYATVVFYTDDREELSRVLIAQNPSGYPLSAIAMGYVPAGAFRPGAYNAAGNAVSAGSIPFNTPQQSNLVVRISSFFIAKKETSVQDFCDFLNDLGITSIAQLSSANTILGKVGTVATDYLGLSGILSYSGISSTGSVRYLNNKWQPAQTQILLSSSNDLSTPINVGNYPINEISFYSSADYNYWLHKYYGKTLSRTSDNLLPTEMEWEAAARGIILALTFSGYNNSSDLNKNGLYPYAFPQNSAYNNGLTGREIGDIPVLKSISWHNNTVGWAKTTGGMNNNQGNNLIYLHPSANLYPNRIGLYDLNGNVGEWVYDNANSSVTTYSLGSGNVTNPVNRTISSNRVVRGGGIDQTAGYNSNTSRAFIDPTSLDYKIGFRAIIRPSN